MSGLLRGGGWGFLPATINVAPAFFHRKLEKKRSKKELSSRFILCLLVVFTWQLEILVTSLNVSYL